MESPIWLNHTFKFHIRREWKERGISVISDFIDHLRTPYTMESFIEHYGVKTNFLEYARFSALINEYLSGKDTPETEISTKWQNKTNIEIKKNDFQKSFLLHNKTFTDCFLK